ncbi:hypothetical protein X975_07259, partial [Stegodyphus mimosarum]
MSRWLQIAPKLEMRAIIRFLWAKSCNCTEIYGQLHEVYGENAMSRQAIAKWCNMFENGRTDIDDAKREGRPPTATNSEIAACVNECILANRRITINKISNELDISHGSVDKIIADHLEFRKVCAQWVPRLLTEEHKGKRFESELHFCKVTKRKEMTFWTKS